MERMGNQALGVNQSPLIQDIHQRCQRMAEITRERASTAIVYLPSWNETQRGTPNSFLRSALFGAIQSKDRIFVKDQLLASQEGITVTFTGEQLNQEDLSTWQTLVHLAREQPLGKICQFTGYSILNLLELPKSAAHYKTLHSSIYRLVACMVRIESDRYMYGAPLIKSFTIDKKTKAFNIELNRDLIFLFGENDWTAIEWKQRVKMRRKPLAQALHAYYSTHKTPYPVKVETIKELTGSRNSQPASFKRQCRSALDELVKIGFLQSYTIEGDLVTVKRVSTPILKGTDTQSK